MGSTICNLVLAVLAILSRILFTISICCYIGDNKRRKYYTECTGTIQRIWKRHAPGDPPNQFVISPIVSYTVCGKTYELVGTRYSKDMAPGQQVGVLYDPDAPSKAIMTKGLYAMSFVTGIVGAAFTFGFLVIAVLRYVGLIPF